MKRDCDQEEDLSQLLQFLDDEAEGTSHDGNNHGEPELEPKHKIFLSHSGVQKNFTEQLCVDLERLQYYSFFDKRPDSLPKGKNFPRLIFQAAQQCRVAVLILTEEFFTNTKWPMLELEAFVDSQNKNPKNVTILPVYLGLSRNECTKNEARRLHWLSVWQEWAKNDDRINVGKWENALKVLSPSNGIEYAQILGEVTLREQIASAILQLVPPENKWSDAHIQGKTRICKAIIAKFARTKPSPLFGVCIVGIYGVGGIGKTTFCKVFCDELYMKFRGKVCHVEFGSKESIELKKDVLRELTNTNPDSLTFKTEDMITNLLRRRIRQQQVFLALDNVWQESIEQAKVYLRVGFHSGSIVMVTARSIDILCRLNIDKSACLEMPELEEKDARWLFLHHATPRPQLINNDHEKNIQYCIRQCRFHKGMNIGEHFHPLALKVLGSQLGSLGCDPNIWMENLSKDDKFNQFQEKEHPIFNILRRGYDLLCKEDQVLFMDVVLFHPSQRFTHMKSIGNLNGFATQAMRHIYSIDIYEWLSIVHQSEMKFIKDRLQGLKAMSLLEDVGDGFYGVTIHDLYVDFAKLEVKRGSPNDRRWIWYDRDEAYPTELARRPSGNCWPNLERVYVKYNDNSTYINNDNIVKWTGTTEGIKWQHFSNIVVLNLYIGMNEVLDLHGLQCLRSLELKWTRPNGDEDGGKLLGLGELRNLGWLELCNIHYAPCFEEISRLTMLEVLQLKTTCNTNSYSNSNCVIRPLSPPNLDKCIHLRELVLQRCECLKAFPDLSKLRSLRKVLFEGCNSASEVVGLGSQLSALHELLIISCSALCHCHGLGDLVSLQELSVQGCSKLLHIPDLHKLTNLRRLSIMGGINQVLGFSSSMLLQDLVVIGGKELPNLHLLRHLQRLAFQHISGPLMPHFGTFTALEELIINHLPEVEELPDIHKLTKLRRFTIEYAPKLLQLPMLGDLVALQYLTLIHCCTSVEIAELPNLHNLTNLQVLDLTYVPIKILPSLKCLLQLRDLRCSFTQLVELPDLSGSKHLERIDLCGCHHLTSLGNLETCMPALEYLNVTTCYRLERLPDLTSFKSLEYLGLCHSGVRHSPEDLMTLATLSISKVFVWDHYCLDFSKMLETMSLTEVVMKLEAKQFEYFTTLQTVIWHFTHVCMHDMTVSAVDSISDR